MREPGEIKGSVYQKIVQYMLNKDTSGWLYGTCNYRNQEDIEYYWDIYFAGKGNNKKEEIIEPTVSTNVKTVKLMINNSTDFTFEEICKYIDNVDNIMELGKYLCSHKDPNPMIVKSLQYIVKKQNEKKILRKQTELNSILENNNICHNEILHKLIKSNERLKLITKEMEETQRQIDTYNYHLRQIKSSNEETKKKKDNTIINYDVDYDILVKMFELI
jgi:hypothetical protein